MASIDQALVALMKADTALIDVVGENIFRRKLPQNTVLPAVSFARVTDIGIHAMSIDSTVKMPLYQFSLFAKNETSMELAVSALIALLQDYSGTVLGVVISRIFIENRWDTYDDNVESLMTPIDFRVNYS